METIYKPSSYYQAVEGCDLFDYGKIVLLTFVANLKETTERTSHLDSTTQTEAIENEKNLFSQFVFSISNCPVKIEAIQTALKIYTHLKEDNTVSMG